MARKAKFADEEIVDRAMRMFWRNGWSATSIRDLERELDLKAPSIYRRFGNKDGLGVAVIERYVDRVIERRVDLYLTGAGDPLSNIRDFLESAVTPGPKGAHLVGCLLTTTAMEIDHVSPELAAALRNGLVRIEAGLRHEVERAAGEGRLSAGLTVDHAVDVVTLSMQGLMAFARSGVESGQLRTRARAVVVALSGEAISDESVTAMDSTSASA